MRRNSSRDASQLFALLREMAVLLTNATADSSALCADTLPLPPTWKGSVVSSLVLLMDSLMTRAVSLSRILFNSGRELGITTLNYKFPRAKLSRTFFNSNLWRVERKLWATGIDELSNSSWKKLGLFRLFDCLLIVSSSTKSAKASWLQQKYL